MNLETEIIRKHGGELGIKRWSDIRVVRKGSWKDREVGT